MMETNEWKLLDKQSWIVLKEIADKIGENLGERIDWIHLRLEEIESIKSRYKL